MKNISLPFSSFSQCLIDILLTVTAIIQSFKWLQNVLLYRFFNLSLSSTFIFATTSKAAVNILVYVS